MSYINFESSRVKEAERRERKHARELILEKAEADYNRTKEIEERARLRGDDKWILPSLESRLKEESKKEKKNKHKKKKKKKKSKKRKSSSSDSDDESEDEWIEKSINTTSESSVDNVPAAPSPSKKITAVESDTHDPTTGVSKDEKVDTEISSGRDEWMTLPGLFPCVSREQLRQQSGRISKAEEQKQKDKYMLDTLGQSERELNPYWKDGGTGLPQEEDNKEQAKSDSRTLPTKAVGDHGVNWLRRALKRTKEQAAEEGRSVEEVAAERWGSLAKLEEMLAEAEESSRSRGRHGTVGLKYGKNKQNDRRSEWRDEKRDADRRRTEDDLSRKSSDGQRHRNEDFHDRSSRTFQKPRADDDSSYRQREKEDSHSLGRNQNSASKLSSRISFQKPSEDADREVGSSHREFQKPEDIIEPTRSSYRPPVRSGNWRKKDSGNVNPPESANSDRASKEVKSSRKSSTSSSSSSDSEVERKKSVEVPTVLTDKEMNDLGAKLVKAEILGNETLAQELKKKLDAARAARSMKSAEAKQTASAEEEVVVLTREDSRGFVHPLQQSGQHAEPSGGRRRKQKTETHADGKRVRYYADDDKYSLKEMFEREKLRTVEDEAEMFSKLAAKGVGHTDDDYDMDDVFTERMRLKESDGKVQARERGRAIKEHKMVQNCNWCFDSKEMLKHLVVAIGSKVYLCLPPYQSLTEGHCLILPMYHMSCATQLDEDVWSEMQTFKKTLTSMFRDKLDLDVVYFETAMYLRKFPHMMLECVPMPRETGDLAPIYFKKAILECETEWSTNKKLVDLSGKDVRRAVPKELPYFTVDFGLDSGFAHVIEDEKMFPKNFAQEIIGGMLDLDHSLWRKQRRENFDLQRKKVLQFAEWWKSYDFTVAKQADSKESSDSD